MKILQDLERRDYETHTLPNIMCVCLTRDNFKNTYINFKFRTHVKIVNSSKSVEIQTSLIIFAPVRHFKKRFEQCDIEEIHTQFVITVQKHEICSCDIFYILFDYLCHNNSQTEHKKFKLFH